MSKRVYLKVCLFGTLISIVAGIVMAVAPPPTAEDKQQAEIKAYFEKTPEELHQDLLKKQMQDQEWLDEQQKQAKKKKMIVGGEGSPSQNEKTSPPVPEPSISSPTTPPPAGANAPAQKSPEDYSRGY